MLPHIRLVLFDLDNTLFPFDSYWMQATSDTFSHSTLTKHLPYEEFLSLYSHYDQHFWKLHDQGEISLDEVRQQRLIHTLRHFHLEVGAKEADAYFHSFFNRLIRLLMPDETVHTYLRALRKSYQIGMITNGKASEQRRKLVKLQLDEVFSQEDIFISEEMGFEKPQREAFHLPLAKYNVEPNQAVYIGDSWTNDIVGAIDAGMSAIWLNPKGARPSSEHKPLLVTENIHSLQKQVSFSIR